MHIHAKSKLHEKEEKKSRRNIISIFLSNPLSVASPKAFLHCEREPIQHSAQAVSKDFLQWRMASRTATSALPWHQYSAAADGDGEEALDVDRRAGVAVASALVRGAEKNTRPAGTGSRRSALALRHRGTRKRRYLSRILRVASSGLAPPAGRRAELATDAAGVLCAVWNAGEEHADASQGRRRLSSENTRPALAGSSGELHAPAARGRPKRSPSPSDDDDVHRIENSSSGSMSMKEKDAVELLKDSPRAASASASRRSNGGPGL